jgi:carboxypeptidase D
MIGALWEVGPTAFSFCLTMLTSRQNGPIHVSSNGSMYANNYSWHHIADYFWLDQPV